MNVDDNLNDPYFHILILLTVPGQFLFTLLEDSCALFTSKTVLSFINSFTFMVIKEYGKCIWILPFAFFSEVL